MRATGTFDVTMNPGPLLDDLDGVSRSQLTFDKSFAGALSATSTVSMLAVRTPVENSAGYVATERITGTVDGRQGSFVVLHVGVLDRGADSLVITVVPDSGTGELAGISGAMSIAIDDGAHAYVLDYELRD